MVRSRTSTAPTCLRSQVARVATWRAMSMKYWSHELRSCPMFPPEGEGWVNLFPRRADAKALRGRFAGLGAGTADASPGSGADPEANHPLRAHRPHGGRVHDDRRGRMARGGRGAGGARRVGALFGRRP